MSRPRQVILLLAIAVVAIAAAAGCGDGNEPIANRGAALFNERCSGCHTLNAAGAEGTIPDTRPTGPDLDKRPETKDAVLYAIRNGGFSGAIMPQNVVVGDDAEAVAEFVAKYAGSEAKSPPSPKGPTGAAGAESENGSGAGG